MRLLPITALVLAAHALSGCSPDKAPVTTKSGGVPVAPAPGAAAALSNTAAGKDLLGFAPASDFSGAAPEDDSRQASAMFDGAPMRDAVAANSAVPGPPWPRAGANA